MYSSLRIILPVLLAFTIIGCTRSTSSDYADEMHEQHADDSPEASPMLSDVDTLDVVSERVTYESADGTSFSGFLAYPDTAEAFPGVIMIHEWWGLNENIETMAQKLAAEGYQVLAVDLYGGEVAEQPDEARAIMQSALETSEVLDANLRAAYAFLDDRGAPRIGVIGWCFGGGWSLETALAMPSEIDATVIYYGRLVLDADRLGTLEMPVLAYFGADDTSIPVDSVAVFDSLLNATGVESEVHVVSDAGHAFANPSGENYVPDAAEEAWEQTLAFFDEHLR